VKKMVRSFNELQRLVYEEYKKNGYLHKWFTASQKLGHGLQFITDLAELGLVNTEVSEALEEIRNLDYEKVAKECAGIIIRVMNFCSRHNIQLEYYILAENQRNLKRKPLHNRKAI